MQVFKAALRIFTKHPIYISIYIIYLSFMGLFIGVSNVGAPEGEFVETRPDIAVIDRDDSELSRAVTDFLSTGATIIELGDSRSALQDATAQNLASYIAIIPADFGDDFSEAITSDGTAPSIETIVSYESISANMMNGRVNEYLDTVRTLVASGAAADETEAIRMAADNLAEKTDVELMQMGEAAPLSQQYLLYMKFSGYTAMLGIIVCIGVVMAAFNRTEVRKRDLASPISSISMNTQIAAACIVIMLITWAWVNILAFIVFGSALLTAAPATITLIVLGSLVFCTVAGAFGFLLGQVTTSEMAMNAAGNIIGLALSFLGGLWIPLDMMGNPMLLTIARFMPTYYYGDALDRASSLLDFSGGSLAPIFIDYGIILLFAAAVFAIALAIGRVRVRSAEAGGNAAAAVVR